MTKEYTDTCADCGDQFTPAKPCCCDDGCNAEYTLHADGLCTACCGPHPGRISQQHTLTNNDL